MQWPSIAALGIAPYLTRGSFILFPQAKPLPLWLERALNVIPLAFLDTLISQALAGFWTTRALLIHVVPAVIVGGLLC